MTDLRYPIGRFTAQRDVTPDLRHDLIRAIAEAPRTLRSATAGLSDDQLETPYRPDGWTIRQVVHHVPDSHMNAYVRFKLALTEDRPTIKTYEEAAWARLPDTSHTPIAVSLDLLDTLHHRWVALLESMSAEQFARELTHPDRGLVSLDWMLQLYAWHGRHHTAHVTALRQREGWG
jgi:uncharacterized damage-inducible protein DinB